MTGTATNPSSNTRGVNLRVHSFIRRQARDLKKGGLPALRRRGLVLLSLGLAILPVLLVRMLRPIVLIRFGWLRSERIGHFAVETEFYLCERDAGLQDTRAVDIFYYRSKVCNQQLKRMFERALHISPFVRPLCRLNRILPGGKKHTVNIITRDGYDTIDVLGLVARTRPHFSFTEEEEQLGRAALHQLGIQDGTPFVCFHARDPAYLDAWLPNGDWRYHDYRDSSIHNHVPAAEALAHRGYFAIRMGAVVKEALDTTNPMIIDYATRNRTDFLDIYLGAKCRFFICDNTGIVHIARLFRRPVAWVNFIPVETAHLWCPDELFIPKKLWLRKEGRFMTFREIFESGVRRLGLSEQYHRLGIEPIENTPEEITSLVLEMDERLKGTWQSAEEDEELQQCFWSLSEPSESNRVFLSRIGAEFLRQNRHLLD